MLLVVQSRKSVAEIERVFPDVAARHNFSVLGVHSGRPGAYARTD